MKAVFLDYATMGPDLDPSPISDLLPDLTLFDVTPDELTAERIRGAEFVFTNKIRFDDETLGNANSLRFIGLTATGTDNVDLSGADKYGIAVCNIRAYCSQSVVSPMKRSEFALPRVLVLDFLQTAQRAAIAKRLPFF